jgi:hypothetical protein
LIRISTFLSNRLFLKGNLTTQPQPFGVRNEMENPKGADMKPPRGYMNSLGGSYFF